MSAFDRIQTVINDIVLRQRIREYEAQVPAMLQRQSAAASL